MALACIHYKLYIMLLYIIYYSSYPSIYLPSKKMTLYKNENRSFLKYIYICQSYQQSMQHKVGEMVFAKCQNYPFWPGKIISISNLNSYKVLFYGQKSEAMIDEGSILPFNEQNLKRVTFEGRNNRDLKHSLNIASKRYYKRKKGLASSSQEDDFFQDSEPPKRAQIQEIQKQKRIVNFKTPQDPHLQLSFLLNNLGHQAATFSQSKTRGTKFTPENQARLKQLLDPTFGLKIEQLIENKVIQKFIIVLKEIQLWGLKIYTETAKLVRDRYEQYKSFILSQQFVSFPLRQARKQIIIQKVATNKAVL